MQIVREGATAQHKELVAGDERNGKTLKQMSNASGRNVGNYFTGGTEKSHQPGGRDEVIVLENQGNSFTVGGSLIGEKNQGSVLQYHIQPSLAEGVLQAHKCSIAIQTEKNRITGLYHLYDIEYDFTSRFPISFRWCFICGAIDYFSKDGCPLGINSKEKRTFFSRDMGS